MKCQSNFIVFFLIGFFYVVYFNVLYSSAISEENVQGQHRGKNEQWKGVAYFGRLLYHQDFSSYLVFNDPLLLVQGGEVVLSNAEHTFRVPTKADGSFVIYDVPYGTYHLHAEFADYIYPTVRVDITQKTSQGIVTPIIRTYTNDAVLMPTRGTALDDSSAALIPFLDVHAYYVPRVQYTLGQILMNPFVLLMILTMVMFGLMRLVPEEERRLSMREMQKLRGQTGALAEAVEAAKTTSPSLSSLRTARDGELRKTR